MFNYLPKNKICQKMNTWPGVYVRAVFGQDYRAIANQYVSNIYISGVKQHLHLALGSADYLQTMVPLPQQIK